MKNKLFVLFIVIIFSISIGILIKYDKKEIEKQKINEEINKEIRENEIINNTMNDDYAKEEINKNIENKKEDIGLGKLKIEKIGLDGPIKEGSTNEILKKYIGHIEETDIYNGNVGLAAHNRGNEYSYFAKINELNKGDKIIYESVYGTKVYKVNDKKEILETDWSMLDKTKDNRITLITCIKNKVNKRLCVQAIEDI